MKRILDFIIALLSLVVFSPLFLIGYLIIRLEDGGPAFFSQERVGRDGRLFRIYKFRSMKTDVARDANALVGMECNDDLTRCGRFLRDHHLDELPQLWNVLKGDMAFVGPRPERPFFVDQIMQHDARYERLYVLRPGVTSYATLHNGYTDTMEKMLVRLELDLYYLEHHNLWLDACILAQTFCRIVSGKRF